MQIKEPQRFLSLWIFILILFLGSSLHGEMLLSPELAKSTTWLSLFAKKDQDRLRSLVSALDKARIAMIQDVQTTQDALLIYENKVRILETLLDRYRNDEAAFTSAEQWLELPPLSLIEAQKELSRLKQRYLADARAYADYKFGHRSAGTLLTYKQQEEILLKNGKAFADFIAPRIKSLGKTALKALALSLASRLQTHPDCPEEILDLVAAAEKLSSVLYRQWIVLLAQGSPSLIQPSALKGLKDTPEGQTFDKTLTLFSDAYTCKKQMRELIPVAISLRIYTDRLAHFIGTDEQIPLVSNEFLEKLFSDQIVQLCFSCSSNILLRHALFDILTMSWVYGTRPELWQDGRWPFGPIPPERVRTALLSLLAAPGAEPASAVDDKRPSQTSWEAILRAESFARQLQYPQDLSNLLSVLSEFMLQEQSFSLFFESQRYETERAELLHKLNKALYGAPSVSSLVSAVHNQAFLFIQWQSRELLPPELLGLLIQANKKNDNGELHPWLHPYILAVGRMRGIPGALLINNNLYGTETNSTLYMWANNGSFRLVYYTNRLGLQE